jgi:hypothetical protein
MQDAVRILVGTVADNMDRDIYLHELSPRFQQRILQYEGLLNALREARGMLEFWAAYADFREKHGLAHDLLRLEEAIKKAEAGL